MNSCKHCGEPLVQNKIGRPKKFCDTRCKDLWRHHNSAARAAFNERYKEHKRVSGYHKKRYKEDQEYQKARALTYYYENRDRILEQKRSSPGKSEVVEGAISKIRAGKATIHDAHEWMEANLGFHSLEVETFIVEMMEDE